MARSKTKLISQITQKYQATIPKAVREKLGIEKGDYISFEIQEGGVLIKKVSSIDWEYLESVSDTLSEWSSEADEKAYHHLIV